MDEIMLRVAGITKQYRLGQIGGTTLRDELQRLGAKIKHKEDPTKRIGEDDYVKGQTFMALDGVSFDVQKGERVGLIGRNGAGKSTLLKIISRVTAPTDGYIALNGRVASMLEVGTGFHGELTGRENIYMNGAILGMSKKEIDRKIEDIIDFSECRQFIDTPVKRYSSGMYVKLAFSVAAHLDSEIMIMDEVLAVGDAAFQTKCLNKMNEVSAKESKTILYVSHNMNTIRQLCNRCIVLSHGTVIFDGDVEEGIQKYLGDTEVSEKTVDLSNVYRRQKGTITDGGFMFTRYETDDRDRSIYQVGEKMRFDLSYSAEKTLDKVGFRITVTGMDGNPIETSNTEGECRIDKTACGRLAFELDISGLAPGMYTMRINANTMNEFLSFGTYDVLSPGDIIFKVIPTEEFNRGMQWIAAWWGHSVGTPLTVTVH